MLVGEQTWQRKHVDWETSLSIRDATLNPSLEDLMGNIEPLLIERVATETKCDVKDADWYKNNDGTWSWMFWRIGQLCWTNTVKTEADIAKLAAIAANQDELRRQLEHLRSEECDPAGRSGAHCLHDPEVLHANTRPHVYDCICGAKWIWDGGALVGWKRRKHQ